MTAHPSSAILEPPAIYGDLSLGARVAYGAWLMALFDVVAHVDQCPFGCTDGRALCSDGVHVFEDEYERWVAWHGARESEGQL